MEKILKDIARIFGAVSAVFLFAYLLGEDADNIVGWTALGLAATATRD